MKRIIVPILKNDLDFELSSFIVVMRELNVEIKKIMLNQYFMVGINSLNIENQLIKRYIKTKMIFMIQ